MKDYENTIREFLKERGWDKLRPSDLSKSIAIEAAELLEVFQWESLTLEEVKANEEKMSHLKKELADVMNYCFELSVLLDLDTEKILREKLEKVKEKYPAHVIKNMGDVEPGTEKEYLDIKKKYRQENNA